MRRAWPRDTVNAGPHVARAPDIILELAEENGYTHNVLRSRGGPAFRRLHEAEYLGGKERGMNGTHRPLGVLFWSQPLQAPAVAALQDVAPTVLAAMGLPAPPMDGRALLQPADGTAAPASPAPVRPLDADEQERMAARLRALGYYE